MPKATARGGSSGGIEDTANGATSITRESEGQYRVLLSTAMANTNYCVLAAPTNDDGSATGGRVTISWQIADEEQSRIYVTQAKSDSGARLDLDFAFAV